MAIVQSAERTGVNTTQNGIRAFDIGRDLRPVAELIADAFAHELDDRGAAALREMRLMSRLGGLLGLLNMSTGDFDDFFGGFVWVEEGKVIGNITVQRADKYGSRWQIANVAVARAWRGRGISRKLMEKALQHIRAQGGKWAVLQVYAENEVARTLYDHLGFEVVGGVMDMEAPRQARGVAPPYLPGLRTFAAENWQPLFDLANSQWSAQTKWWRSLRRNDFQHSFEQQFGEWAWRQLGRRRVHRASITAGERNERFEAAVVLTAERWSAPHKISLWVRPEHYGKWEDQLVEWALNTLSPYPVWRVTTSISHEHEAARRALERLGFLPKRTLLTMKLATSGSHTGGLAAAEASSSHHAEGVALAAEVTEKPKVERDSSMLSNRQAAYRLLGFDGYGEIDAADFASNDEADTSTDDDAASSDLRTDPPSVH